MTPDEVPEWDWTRGLNARTTILRTKDWEAQKKTMGYLTETPELTYPRLVRVTPFFEEELEQVPTPSVLTTLRGLAKHLPKNQAGKSIRLNPSFEDGVVKSVTQIGLLDSGGFENRLWDFCLAVVTAQGWWAWTLMVLAEPEYRPDFSTVDNFKDPLLSSSGWLEWFIEAELRTFAHAVGGSTNAEWIRNIGAEHTAAFLSKAQTFQPTSDLTQLRFSGGAATWLRAEIAMMLRNSHQRQCANLRCKREPLFMPTHGNQIYCSRRCERNTAMRKRRPPKAQRG